MRDNASHTHTQTPVDDNKSLLWSGSSLVFTTTALQKRFNSCILQNKDSGLQLAKMPVVPQRICSYARFLHETYLRGELEGGEVVVVARHSGHVLHSQSHLLTHQVLTHCLSNTNSFIVSSSPGLRIRINLGSLIQVLNEKMNEIQMNRNNEL